VFEGMIYDAVFHKFSIERKEEIYVIQCRTGRDESHIVQLQELFVMNCRA